MARAQAGAARGARGGGAGGSARGVEGRNGGALPFNKPRSGMTEAGVGVKPEIQTEAARAHRCGPPPGFPAGGTAGSECQTLVLKMAARTIAQLRAGPRRVELVATNTVKVHLPPLEIVELPVPSIIVEPQPECHGARGTEVDDGRDTERKSEHGTTTRSGHGFSGTPDAHEDDAPPVLGDAYFERCDRAVTSPAGEHGMLSG